MRPRNRFLEFCDTAIVANTLCLTVIFGWPAFIGLCLWSQG